jgi:hypothetical protein
MQSDSEGKHLWKFGHKKAKFFSNKDLKRYQQKLLEIKSKHEKDESFRISHSYFSSSEKESYPDNIFAKFGGFRCSKHGQVHSWHLLWDPNLSNDEFWSFLNNDCIEEDFKTKSKSIQRQIVHEFPEYFNLVDSGPVDVNISTEAEKKVDKTQTYEEEEYDEKREYFDDIFYD